MIAKLPRLQEISVCRQAAPMIGLIVGLTATFFPGLASAQVNIDQGKSPAEIYSSDCATCHKTMRGLAAGKNSLMLSSFLREHYTASSDQASALAAYVLGGGGGEAAPKPKPVVEHARAEEPKASQARADGPKGAGPKPATHPVRAAAKPEEEKRLKEEDAKREENRSPAAAEKHEDQPETASRGEKTEPESAAPAAVVAPVLAPVAATPAANEASRIATPANAAPAPERSSIPSLELGSTTTAAPGEQPSAAMAVPRDNIPD
ncbi:MAG: hypothetical protein WCA56_01445 [Xanthobacteraceae bacterium]